ncbi:MAG TPA: peptide MFS transporter [Gemmatimonadales bacterium]
MTDQTSDTGFFGHPRGLSTLFFTEMWERFSYYGMRALLILFMTAPLAIGGLAMPVEVAGAIYGTYTAMVYLMTLGGGWVADKLLGLRRSVFWGGFLIMLGHISLALPAVPTFYFGLVLVVLGTGLLKGNISALVGQLYGPEDIRRDAGYSLYYMGINLGGFLGPLVCGYLAQDERFRTMLEGWGMSPQASWHWGFGAAAVGMFFGLIQYVLGKHRLPASGEAPAGVKTPEEAAAARGTAGRALAIAALLIAVLAGLQMTGTIGITPAGIAVTLDWLLLVATVGFFAWLFSVGQWTKDERRRLVVILVLFLGASVFWAGFEQAGSSLNLFAERNTANTIFGFAYPASWLQSVNSFFIIVFAPVFAWLWIKLGARNPSSPAKFSLGLLLLAAGFGVMIFAGIAATGGEKVSPMWLISFYLLATFGELCLSPVGLSAMSKLAPERVAGLMMGVWFLASSVGNKIAGRMGGLYESLSLPMIFALTTAFPLVFALILAALVRPIRRMLART